MSRNSISQKNIIFRFKDSKIVKSRKSNRCLSWCTNEELADELRKAFQIIADKKNRSKASWKDLMSLQRMTWGRKSSVNVRPLSTPCSKLHRVTFDSANAVNVDIEPKNDTTLLVTIGPNQKGCYRNYKALETKIMFCKAVSYFYKTVEKTPTTIVALIRSVQSCVL